MPLGGLGGFALLGELLFANVRLWHGAELGNRRDAAHARGLRSRVRLIAFGSLVNAHIGQVLLANPPLRFLAIISYNLYLYHQLIAREMVTWHFPDSGRSARRSTLADPIQALGLCHHDRASGPRDLPLRAPDHEHPRAASRQRESRALFRHVRGERGDSIIEVVVAVATAAIACAALIAGTVAAAHRFWARRRDLRAASCSTTRDQQSPSM